MHFKVESESGFTAKDFEQLSYDDMLSKSSELPGGFFDTDVQTIVDKKIDTEAISLGIVLPEKDDNKRIRESGDASTILNYRCLRDMAKSPTFRDLIIQIANYPESGIDPTDDGDIQRNIDVHFKDETEGSFRKKWESAFQKYVEESVLMRPTFEKVYSLGGKPCESNYHGSGARGGLVYFGVRSVCESLGEIFYADGFGIK